MSPSRRRTPRVGGRIAVLAVLVALAASVFPLVPIAAANYPGPEADAPIDTSRPSLADSPVTPPDRFPLYPLVTSRVDPATDPASWQALLAPLDPAPISPHMNYTLTTDSCAACHRTHSAQGTMILAEAAPQAALCFTCHNGTGSNLDVLADFTSPYAHPATVDLNHTPGVEDEFGGLLDRHATCTDCHDPHRTDGTLATASAAGWSASGATVGASGVSVVNGAAGSAPTYSLVRGLSFEYQLCFKCHSGFTALPPQDSAHPSAWALDKGIELNPANGSYHPIEAAGKNGTAAMTASLAGGTLWQFNVGSTIRCVNCHGDPSKVVPGTDPGARLAPHASTERGLLIAPYRDRLLKSSGEAYAGTDFTLCFLCHSATPFTATGSGATDFDLHATHIGGIAGKGSGGVDIDVAGAGQGNAICAECHFRLHSTALAVKPGDVNNARLVNFAPNVLPRSGVLAWTGAGSGTCTLTCHGVSHRTTSYQLASVQNAALARISIEASGTNLVGAEHTFTVTVERTDGSGWTPAVGITVNPSEVGVGDITGGTCDGSAPGTDDLGQCTIIVNSSVAAMSTVDATATVAVDGVVGPAIVGVSTAGNGAYVIQNLAVWVDARITIGASDTNFVDEPHTFAVTVEQNDGTGWTPAVGIAVDPSEVGVGDITGGTCDGSAPGTDDLGQCTIVVSSSVPGASTVGATATVIVGGVSIDVSTSGYGAHDIDNTKTWEPPPPP